MCNGIIFRLDISQGNLDRAIVLHSKPWHFRLHQVFWFIILTIYCEDRKQTLHPCRKITSRQFPGHVARSGIKKDEISWTRDTRSVPNHYIQVPDPTFSHIPSDLVISSIWLPILSYYRWSFHKVTCGSIHQSKDCRNKSSPWTPTPFSIMYALGLSERCQLTSLR